MGRRQGNRAVKAVRLCFLAAAVACGTGLAGCGQGADGGNTGGAGGVAGAGGAVEGCVDIAITPALLPGPKKWVDVGHVAGTLWATEGGLRVAWVTYELYESWAEKTSIAWLALGTLEPDSATVVDASVYSLFPPDVTYSESAIYSFAGRPDGAFAVGYGWTEAGTRPQRAGIGRLGSPALENTVVLPSASSATFIGIQSAAAWDGQAFALHAYDAPPQFALFVARIDDKANVLLPFTEFGLTPNPSYMVFTDWISTHPTSGRTFVFDAESYRVVNAHERDGKPAPFTQSGPMLLDAQGASEKDSLYGAVDADDDGGAWFAWADDVSFSIDPSLAVAHLDASGSVTHSFKTHPPPDDPGAFGRHALVARGQEAWLVSATGYRMYTFQVTEAGLSEPSVLVDGLYEQTDMRYLEAIEYQGEYWVAYTEIQGEQVRARAQGQAGLRLSSSTPRAQALKQDRIRDPCSREGS